MAELTSTKKFKSNNRYAPSKSDTSVFDALGKAPSDEYANIARWYRHISSFSANERNGWAGSAVPQVSGGTTTTGKIQLDI